jgi:hypothetical protein
MANSPKTLANKLILDGQRTISFFENLSQAQWDTLVYTNRSIWSIKKILQHFISSENGNRTIIENIVNGGDGAPDDVDIDHFNEVNTTLREAGNVGDLLINFQYERKWTVNIVSSLSIEDLEKIGRHPFLGRVKLIDIIKLISLHNQLHIRDIRQILNSVRS